MASKPFPVAFPWPYKGINTGWPACAQPSLSTPSALNVMTDEPQRGRSRGGSRNGTKKAFDQLLGDGSSSFRVSGLLQVTKMIDDPGTPGSGGGSGLYQLVTNQEYFADTTNANAPMEDLYSGYTLGTDSDGGVGDPLAFYYGLFGAGRGGTWTAGDPLADAGPGILAFQDSDDLGGVAVVRDSNYHASDSFLVELHGIVGFETYAFLSARVKTGDIGTTTGVLTLQLTIDLALEEHTISLWKGATLINAWTVATTSFGEYRMGLRLIGSSAQVQLNGAVVATQSVGSTSSTARGVAFGAYKTGVFGNATFHQIRALQPTTANDFGTDFAVDDFSTYATGQQAEATGPFDVGTADEGAPAGTTDQTEFLAMLNGTRAGTDPSDADAGTVGDDGNPFIQTTGAVAVTEGCVVRRTGDLTPADAFEVRLPFERDSVGNGPALMVRIKAGDPTDSDGVISARWRPIWQDTSVKADWVLFLGETVISRGAAPLKGIANGSIATAAGELRLRVEGDLVTILIGDYVVCSGTIGGQNQAARGVAFGSFGITDLDASEPIKVRGLNVVEQDSGSAGSPPEQSRETKLIAVAGEDVYVGDYGDALTKIDNARLSQRKPSLVDLFGTVYLVEGDGSSVWVIDIDAATSTELVASAGTVPENCYVAAAWRGRLVLAGQNDSPQNVYMSKAGDPTDWNYSPAVPSAIQAVALNASTVGKIGQPVIALVPWKDDVLVIGCDHAIYQMTGDPAAGGTIDNISEAIGFLTRDAWTMAPDGTIYFVGTSGFYRMAPGSAPVNLALGKFQQYFQTIDRTSNYVMCSWERDRVGCYIFVVPRIEGAQSTQLWFDAKQEAFWPIQLPTAQGPLSTIVFDGDSPDDRYTLLGGHDGYVRRFDKEADQDDGTAIESYVFIGPINPGGAFEKSKLIEMEVTNGVPTNGMDYAISVGRDATEALGATAEFGGRFEDAGRHQKIRSRARGNTFMLKLGNTVISKAWTMERVDGVFDDSGRMR